MSQSFFIMSIVLIFNVAKASSDTNFSCRGNQYTPQCAAKITEGNSLSKHLADATLEFRKCEHKSNSKSSCLVEKNKMIETFKQVNSQMIPILTEIAEHQDRLKASSCSMDGCLVEISHGQNSHSAANFLDRFPSNEILFFGNVQSKNGIIVEK